MALAREAVRDAVGVGGPSSHCLRHPGVWSSRRGVSGAALNVGVGCWPPTKPLSMGTCHLSSLHRAVAPASSWLAGRPETVSGLQRWDPLTTTLATACLTLGSTSTRPGVGLSTLTSALLPTASTASPPTCDDRALPTSTTTIPAWCPTCPTLIYQLG